MKIAAVTMVTLAATAHSAAGQTGEQKVVVCMEDSATFGIAPLAQMIASGMFARIGVAIQWHHGLLGCPELGIQISLSQRTPRTLKPGALGYARPYEGSHIVLLYDRISEGGRDLIPHLLAHVMVHEITHILQGTDGHSYTGVMKAHWNYDDLKNMEWKPLAFTDMDVFLIHRGLAARAARAEVAMNGTPEAVAAR